MGALLHFLTYLGYSLVLSFVILLIGVVISPRKTEPVDFSLLQLTIHLLLGTSVTVTIATWWAYTAASNIFPSILLTVLALLGLFTVVRKAIIGHKFVDFRGILHLTVVNVGALLIYWPVFKNPSLPKGITAFTNANNDLATYAHYADNISHAGFSEFWRVAGRSAGAMSKNDHTGDSAFLAIAGRLLRLESWAAGIPVIVYVVTLTAVALAALLHLVLRLPSFLCVVIGFWACSGPITGTVQANYFLGQGFCRALLFGLLAVVVLPNCTHLGRTGRVWMISLCMSAGILIYASGALMTAGILLAFSISRSTLVWLVQIKKTDASQRSFAGVVELAGGLAIAVLLILPRLSLTLENIRFYLKAGITGWPLPTWKPEILSNLGSTQLASLSHHWKVFFFVFGLLVILSLARRVYRYVDVTSAVCLLLVGTSAYIFFVITQGSTTYQTWKILGIVQPIVVGVFFGLGIKFVAKSRTSASSQVTKMRFFASLIVTISFACLAINVNQAHFRSVTQIIPEALSTHRNQIEIPQGAVLGIRLNPYFETMITPMVLNLRQVVWSSDTYGGPGTTADLYFERASDQNKDRVVKRYGDFVLVEP